MTFKVCQSLYDKIDQTTATFVHDIATRCVVEITPVVTVGLTLSFIIYGLLIMRGAVGMPVAEFLWKGFRVAIIVNIALAGGLYQSEIAGIIRTLPDDLATALIIKPSQGATAASLIDEAAGTGFRFTSDALNKAGIFSYEGLTYCLVAVIVLLMTVSLVAVGGAFLLLAKVALSILAGLAPLFIVALLFPATTRFFELWLGQVINYILVVVLYAAVLGFMMSMFKNYMVDTKMDGLANVAYTVGGVSILSFSILIILRQLPAIASGLAGGVALSLASGLKLPQHHQEKPIAGVGRASGTMPMASLLSPAPGNTSPAFPRSPQVSPRLASHGYYKGSAIKEIRTN